MNHAYRERDPQRANDRPCELREVVDAHGITVELLVEGEHLFSGRVRHVDLAEVARIPRLARENVVAQLGHQLVARFEQERASVKLSPPVRTSTVAGEGDSNWLVSRYVIGSGAALEAGIAWYDTSTRSVGPDHVPALVRSRMRDAVRRKLAESGPSMLQLLLAVLDGMSS